MVLELRDRVEKVEEVGDGAKEGCENGQLVYVDNSNEVADERNVEEERVYE